MPRTTVFGVYDGGDYRRAGARRRSSAVAAAGISRASALWRIVAKRAMLAAGAIERPIVFGGNDRPGVMLARRVRTYVNRFAVAPGRRVGDLHD